MIYFTEFYHDLCYDRSAQVVSVFGENIMTQLCTEKVQPNTSGRKAPCILPLNHSGDHHISISQWLTDLGSHEIYIAKAIGDDFTKWTGEIPCWKTHSAESTKRAIANRGLGGTLTTPDKNAWGYEIAFALASKYADFRSIKNGRGSMFHDCLDALEKAGL